MITVGSRVRINSSRYFRKHYNGFIGFVEFIYDDQSVRVMVEGVSKRFMLDDLQLDNSNLPGGMKYCKCGAITSNECGSCCDCMLL
jgi:hypothetical protein